MNNGNAMDKRTENIILIALCMVGFLTAVVLNAYMHGAVWK